VIAAKTTGDHRPASISPAEATIANGERLRATGLKPKVERHHKVECERLMR
jgi:hypothetical protein